MFDAKLVIFASEPTSETNNHIAALQNITGGYRSPIGKCQMSDAEKITPACLMAGNIEKLLEFADQQGDFVLGAKMADVQAVFLERYFPSK